MSILSPQSRFLILGILPIIRPSLSMSIFNASFLTTSEGNREGLFVLQSSAERARDQISGAKFPSHHHMLSLLYFGWRSSEVIRHEQPPERGLSPDSTVLHMTAWDQVPLPENKLNPSSPSALVYCTSPFTRKPLHQSLILYK